MFLLNNFWMYIFRLIALSLEELIPYIKSNKDLYKKVTIAKLAKLIVELSIPHGEVRVIASHIKKMKEQNTNNPIKVSSFT